MEITAEELESLPGGTYTVYDIRSETDRNYGIIPGSVGFSAEKLESDPPENDGKIFFISDRPLKIGDYEKVKINDTFEYDLLGELI